MDNNFNNIPNSFVAWQDFLWLGNYVTGDKICEYNPNTQERNDFYKINRKLLKNFGLFGHGMNLYFDVDTGKFSLNGLEILLSYRTKEGIEYDLTGYGNGLYDDIITYKDAWTDAKVLHDGRFINQIHQYNFGFKKKLSYKDGTEFAFQAICSLPFNRNAFIEFKIVPNKDLEGNLIIKKIGKISESIELPLKQGYAWIGNWTIN